MFIDLDRVPAEGQPLERTLPAESLSTEGEEFRLASSVALQGRIEPLAAEGPEPLRPSKHGKGPKPPKPAEEGSYRLRGRMAVDIELTCVRCLEPFAMRIDEELDLLYLPQSRNVVRDAGPGEAGSEDVEALPDRGLDSEELAVSFYRDGRIDLSRLVVEQIVLSLPMKPLCREDCRGLCPECGVNRNMASCECEPDDTDPRWQKLKSLLGS